MPRLTIRSGPSAGSEFEFHGNVIIGRGPMADISVEDPAISRRHASLAIQDGRCIIADLRSGNGTKVNGERIREPRELLDGDQFQCGDAVFVYQADMATQFVPLDRSVVMLNAEQAVLQSIPAGAELGPVGATENDVQAAIAMGKRLQVVYDVGEAISQTLEEDALLTLIMQKLFAVFPQASRGFIMSYDSETRELTPKVARNRRGETAEIAVSRTLVRDAIDNRRGLLSVDAMQDERFAGKMTIQQLEIRSVIVAPMIAKGEVVGVIHIDAGDPLRPYNKDDLALLLGIGSQAGLAVANARMHRRLLQQELLEQDLALAKRIQARFLPSHPPEIRGHEFKSIYIPAMEVGGDYYDFLELGSSVICVALGDVSGKGVSAALLMAKLSSEVRYHSAAAADPAEILRRVNAGIAGDLEEGMFATMMLLALDTTSGELRVSNAGHLTPYVRRVSGDVVPVPVSRSVPVGVIDTAQFKVDTFSLQPGDVCVVYTDGVSEATSREKELFGDERLVAAIRDSDGTAGGILDSVLAAVKTFVGSEPQSDDISLLCFGPRR